MKIQLSSRYGFLLAILSPLLAVHFAIQNLKWKERKSLLVFIITLFGGTIILQTSDGYVLQKLVYDHYVDLGFSQWWFELKKIIFFSPQPETKGDVYSHVMAYFVGNVLNMPGQYFFFVSFVYGYFFINALSKILVWDSHELKSSLFWLLIIIFITYRFVDELQTVRSWTGLWVLFNGVLGYHQSRKSKYLLLMLMTPLFHAAYFIIAIPAFIVVLVKWLKPIVFIVLYLFSFFIQIEAPDVIVQLQTTDLGREKIAGYYREDPSEYRDPFQDKSSNWYKRYGKHWALPNSPHLLALTIIVIGLYSKQKMNELELGLFSTGLLIATLANFGDFIPPFYNRAMTNAGIYIIAVSVLLIVRGELLNATGISLTLRKLLLWTCAISFVPYIFYVISNMLQFTSIFMITLPFLGFYSDLNISIRELLGYIF